ncbi:MAG: HEAT repeat domain-containing protein [Nibricoccus sp.]
MSAHKFQQALAGLRSTDSLTYEESYHTLQGDFLSKHLDEVIDVLKKEADPEIRGRLVELVGDSKEERVVPILKAELDHATVEIRRWALHALGCVDSPSAREISRLHIQQHPEDAP